MSPKAPADALMGGSGTKGSPDAWWLQGKIKKRRVMLGTGGESSSGSPAHAGAQGKRLADASAARVDGRSTAYDDARSQ